MKFHRYGEFPFVEYENSTSHPDIAQLGSAPGLGPGGRRFKSCYPDHGSVAKQVKATDFDSVIDGSNPSTSATFQDFLLQSRLRG